MHGTDAAPNTSGDEIRRQLEALQEPPRATEAAPDPGRTRAKVEPRR